MVRVVFCCCVLPRGIIRIPAFRFARYRVFRIEPRNHCYQSYLASTLECEFNAHCMCLLIADAQRHPRPLGRSVRLSSRVRHTLTSPISSILLLE